MKIKIELKMKTHNTVDNFYLSSAGETGQSFDLEIPDELFKELHNSSTEDVILQEMDEDVMKLLSWDYTVIKEDE